MPDSQLTEDDAFKMNGVGYRIGGFIRVKIETLLES